MVNPLCRPTDAVAACNLLGSVIAPDAATMGGLTNWLWECPHSVSVGIQTQVILGWRQGPGPDNDSVFLSIIKLKSDDTIRAHLRSLQRREPAIKGLVYNVHR